MQPRNIVFYVLVFLSCVSYAQPDEDLLQLLESEDSLKRDFAQATFKGTRLINLRTVEIQGKRTLEFRIAHRFGDVSGGPGSLFGLDGPATIQFAFDYSVTNRLSFGVGRSNLNRLIDGNIKCKLLRQTTDNRMPVTVTYMGMMNATHRKASFPGEFDDYAHRLSFVNDLMIARKFNSNLSLQLSLLHVHTNLVDLAAEKNDVFGAAFSGRYKITKRIAITGEYAVPLNEYSPNPYFHTSGFGVDIETGGHVFQMFFVNSFAINEAQVLPYTTHDWKNGGFRWGFNVSRVFSL